MRRRYTYRDRHDELRHRAEMAEKAKRMKQPQVVETKLTEPTERTPTNQDDTTIG